MQEKSLIKKNILQFLEIKGITKYNFYQLTGITRGILDQNNGMSEENTAKFLACFPEINAEWLIMGIGSMYKIQNENDINCVNKEIRQEKKQEPSINFVDKNSMGFILDRYEALAAENALLKKENEELKQLTAKSTDSVPYPENSVHLSTSVAADPAHK